MSEKERPLAEVGGCCFYEWLSDYLLCQRSCSHLSAIAFHKSENPLHARSAWHFIKWQHNDTYGCSVGMSMKKPEVALLTNEK